MYEIRRNDQTEPYKIVKIDVSGGVAEEAVNDHGFNVEIITYEDHEIPSPNEDTDIAVFVEGGVIQGCDVFVDGVQVIIQDYDNEEV